VPRATAGRKVHRAGENAPEGESEMETFISYKFKDDDNKYENIRYAFENAGVKFWSTREIAAGQKLPDELRNAIRRCSICVFIATPNSLESDWCQAEIGAFWGLGRPVIVYLADDKLTEDKLPKQFVGQKFATTIKEVVEAVKLNLSKSTGTSQAEEIFGLAIEAFLDKLNLQFKTNSFGGFGTVLPGVFDEKPHLRWTNAFGQQVSYDTTKLKSEAESDLRALTRKIADFRQRREQQIKKTRLNLFAEVQSRAQSISDHLATIPFGDSTLAMPWKRAQESLSRLWEEKGKELTCFRLDELDRLRAYLEEHPAYQQVYAEEKASIESFLNPGTVSLDELIKTTGNHLKQQMKDLLAEK
jgi:hypothetical protein